MIVRELRYEVGRPGFRTRTVTLVTTLLDAELYPLDALAELYGTRWRVELNLRHLKTDNEDGCVEVQDSGRGAQGIDGLCDRVQSGACGDGGGRARQGVDVERISFVDAMRWLARPRPGDELPELVVNPDRPGRYEPRVRKRRPKQYPLMNKPRSVLRKALLEQGVNA